MFQLFPPSLLSDHREGSNSEETPLFQMVGDGDSTDDITLPLVFVFSREGAVLTAALEDHQNVDVLLLPKERQLGHGEQQGGDFRLFEKIKNSSALKYYSTDPFLFSIFFT